MLITGVIGVLRWKCLAIVLWKEKMRKEDKKWINNRVDKAITFVYFVVFLLILFMRFKKIKQIGFVRKLIVGLLLIVMTIFIFVYL